MLVLEMLGLVCLVVWIFEGEVGGDGVEVG